MKKFIIVIPAHNEEEIIEKNTLKVINFLKKKKLSVDWEVVVAENGSTDKTISILEKMSRKMDKKIKSRFSFTSLKARSRDDAVKGAWLKTKADYYMFMDADLSTDLQHIPELVNYLEQGYDIVLGSRRMPESKVKRPLARRIISWAFHTLMKIIFNLKVKDLQCGFKAINKRVRDNIVPKTKYSEEGFLDTEILAIAYSGTSGNYRIKEIPVKWQDERESKFKISRTIRKVIINSYRIKRDLILGRYK